MNATVKVGIFMTIVLVLAAVLIVKIEDLPVGAAEEVKRIEAVFDSVAGLDEKSAVRVAGIRVGKVEAIELEGIRARAILLIDNPDVVVRQGAYARIVNMGLLGDKYVELDPGRPGTPELGPDAVLDGTVPTGMDDLTTLVGDIGEDVKAVTASLRKAMGGVEGEQRVFEIVENLRATTEYLRDLLETNRDGVATTVANFESFSGDLRTEIPKIAEQLAELTEKLNAVVDENRDNVREGIADARNLAGKLETTVDNLNSITTKINSGEGTIGKLVASDEAHEKLTGTLDSISGGVDTLTETLGMIKRTRFDLGIAGFYHGEIEDSRTEFSIMVSPEKTRRFYQVGVVTAPEGVRKYKEELITTTNPDGSVETTLIQRTKTEDRYAITALVGLRRDAFSFRGGLIEGSGGIGVDWDLPDPRFRLSIDAFDVGREVEDSTKVHLRLTGRYRLNDNLFLAAGWDDPLLDESSSWFFGGGLTWTDDHLKYLLGSVPIN